MLIRIRNALLLIVAGALTLRVVVELIAPVVPALIVLAALAYIISILFTRNGGSS